MANAPHPIGIREELILDLEQLNDGRAADCGCYPGIYDTLRGRKIAETEGTSFSIANLAEGPLLRSEGEVISSVFEEEIVADYFKDTVYQIREVVMTPDLRESFEEAPQYEP